MSLHRTSTSRCPERGPFAFVVIVDWLAAMGWPITVDSGDDRVAHDTFLAFVRLICRQQSFAEGTSITAYAWRSGSVVVAHGGWFGKCCVYDSELGVLDGRDVQRCANMSASTGNDSSGASAAAATGSAQRIRCSGGARTGCSGDSAHGVDIASGAESEIAVFNSDCRQSGGCP